MTKSYQHLNCNDCNIKGMSIFCDLDNHLLDLIQSNKSCDFYKKGEVIFKEGSISRGLFCVNKGKVRLGRMGASGKEQILRFATEGDIIGYNSMLNGKPLSVTATCLEDSSICFIPARHFFHLLKTDSSFSLKILELTAQNWENASRLITNMAQKTSLERLAEMLLWLKDTFGLDQDDCLDVKLSREELANLVGTATEVVIRLLRDLKNKKLIELQGKKIKLIDIHGLVVLGDLIDY